MQCFLEGEIDFIRMSVSKEKAIYINKNNVTRLIFDEEEYNKLIKIKDLEDVLLKTDRDAQAKDIIKKDTIESALKDAKEKYLEHKKKKR